MEFFFLINFFYETPLHMACKYNNADAVKILLSSPGIQASLLDIVFSLFNLK